MRLKITPSTVPFSAISSARCAQFLELEQEFALRFFEDFRARRSECVGPLGRGVGRNVRERHVEHAPAVVQLARRDAEVGILEPARVQHRLDSFALEREHVGLKAARLHRRHRHFDLQHFDHVDRRESAADDDRAGSQIVTRAVVIFFQVVVEPVDQLVLIDEAAIDELVGAFDRKRPIAPGAVGQHDPRESPTGAQIFEIELAAHPRHRDVFDVGMVEALVDFLVLVLALLDVPSREAVLDFSVRTRILLEHDHERAAIGQDARDFRTGGRASDYSHHVARGFIF